MSTIDFLSRATKRKAKQAEISEKNIETAFVKYAKTKNCTALKLVFLFKKSFPDRTILCPGGRIFFIEFKRKGKELTPAQDLIRVMIESFGFEYHMCDVIGQAEQCLDEFLEWG